jgi:hypothetical protein
VVQALSEQDCQIIRDLGATLTEIMGDRPQGEREEIAALGLAMLKGEYVPPSYEEWLWRQEGGEDTLCVKEVDDG